MVKEKYISAIKSIIQKNTIPEVKFFIFGSSLKKDRFKDIDLGIIEKNIDEKMIFKLSHDFKKSTLPFKFDMINLNTVKKSFQKKSYLQGCFMAYLKEKINQLIIALASLEKALHTEFSDISRDASIQRFEYSFELFWKVAKIFLSEKEGIECNSPNNCFREIRPIINCSDEIIETCLAMVKDRNFSVQTYSETMANTLYAKLSTYLSTMKTVLDLINNKEK